MIRHKTDLKTLLPLALWLLCQATGLTRAQEPPDETIGSVEFPGRTWVPYRKLLEASGLKPGDKWGPESGSRALEGLLKLEFIEKVEPPTIVSVPGKPPAIRITITEYPLLEAIEITGSAALSRRSLKDALLRKEGSAFRREDLELAREALRRTYQEDGFLFVQVEAALQAPGPGRVKLLLDIEEGFRTSIRDVFIIGNSELTRDEIIEISGLRPERLFGAVDRGYFVPHQLDSSLDKLRNYYRSRGNLDVKLGLDDISINPSLRDVTISLEIREGARYRLQEIRLEGNQVFGDALLLQTLSFEAGAFYSGAKVEKLQRTLVRIYQERSDRIPQVNARLLYTGENDITVVFQIDEREHLFVDKVEIRGNTRTLDRVIRRHSKLVSGAPLSLLAMDETMARLRSSGHFDDVSFSVDESTAPELRNVRINVKEKEAVGRWDLGGGAASGEGEVGYFRLEHTNFDLFALPRSLTDWSDAFVGGGQSVYAEIVPGNVESQYMFGFHEPYLFSSDRTFTLRAGSQKFYRGAYEESRVKTEPEARQYLDIDHHLSLALAWRLDDVSLGDISASAPATIATAPGSILLSYPRLSLRYAELENNIYGGPKGLLAELKLDAAGPATGSDIEFFRGSASADYYKPLFDRYADLRHLLHVGIEAGWVGGGSDGVPFYENYFLGGPHSFRGFEYREVGPHEQGEPLGGGALLRGTIEYSAPLFFRELRAIALFDWGLLESDPGDFSGGRLRSAAGGGLQFRFPFLGQVVPINLYWAKPLAKQDGDRPEVFSFSIGYAF